MSTVPKSPPPLVKRKKAVRNLKKLMNSSSENPKAEPSSVSVHSFFSEEQVVKNPFLYENLRENIGKRVNQYFLYFLEGYIPKQLQNAKFSTLESCH